MNGFPLWLVETLSYSLAPLFAYFGEGIDIQTDVEYAFVYVDQESFDRYNPTSFRQLIDGFREYKGSTLLRAQSIAD